ncbi:alpha/beta fold hydrolase [Rhodospirillum rubrum]|uniref:Alpha/beta hydrolase fold n=1 Tax=Rhodospirillum rubrum (strain ATCC 11170 / ATH 1.1.1 / DSM 467 / LMG 4362 / NCIMB 8255 / S1) TaxID=269796 RepID=Q2RUX1_RHORT|nr:alpha/beta hydrolase [Rhodospirillum rubrum]ABC22074.1 Alpha/beta hydrolase fold [Rhodospirillum rubrum ATCC 11170]AEO47786.1 alpha/beta hydrolase fold protein [Rhodospirillum rubrum F11]MBK5953663.1 alpha/beta hydrolase [Rhodospirillum rubrum]QXG81726.1 alpha/beta hydrolase [Rhodospirillum rubrum]HAQ00005.1 alpha/beta hydrolase [Rhodospirillum rubrum]
MRLTLENRLVFIETGTDGVDLSRPVVVLIHGAGMTHSAWDKQSAALAADGWAVIAPDLPGHGQSEGPPLTSVSDLSDWLLGVFDALGLYRAVVSGHSLGGLIALEFARHHCVRSAGLALIGTAAALPVHLDLLKAADHDLPRAATMISRWGYTAQADPTLVEARKSQWATTAPGLLHTDLMVCDGYGEGAAAAARIPCPALVVHGEQDRMVSLRGALMLVEILPHGHALLVTNAGHMVMDERPDAVLEALHRLRPFAA